MLIDYLTTAALAHQMRETLLGARVQAVLQPDRDSLSLEMYAGQRSYLTLSASPEHEGLLLSAKRVKRGAGPSTPLTLSARKLLLGTRLATVEQPPYERLLILSFQGAERYDLIAEIMGRMANVILVEEDGTVKACAHTVTGQMTRARSVFPGRPYEAPPAPPKLAHTSVGSGELAAWLTEDPESQAWRVLVRSLLGVSPLVAREAVFRACTDEGALGVDVDAGTLLERLRDLMELPESNQWTPCVVIEDTEVTAYAPYELTHRIARKQGAESTETSVELVPDIAACVARYVEARMGRDPYQDARSAVASSLSEATEAARRRVDALRRERIDDDAIARLRLEGDLILAYQLDIEPGAESFSPPADAGLAGPVTLDPTLSAIDNAQAKYGAYKRKRAAAKQAPVRISKAQAAVATLDQLATDLELAETREGIEGVRNALVDGGFIKAARKGPRVGAPSRPLELRSSDGFKLLVGRNSRQNEAVTFEMAKRGDTWLHARDAPGAHVIVKAAGQAVPDSTLSEAAAVAAWYSRQRADARVTIAVTDVRHVKRMRGGGVGMVVYDHDHSLTVAPVSPDELGLT